MLDSHHVWVEVISRLKAGEKIRTWSLHRGLGPEFRIIRVSKAGVTIAPLSSGEERTLVGSSFDQIIQYLKSPSSELRKKTFNSSYGLGILKHLGLV